MMCLSLKEVFILQWIFTLNIACNDLHTENKRLHGSNFRDLSGSSLYSCAADCASYPMCKSFNFFKSGKICQLNYGNHTTAMASFLNDMDSWYGLMSNWEHISPCTRAGCNLRQKCSVLRNGQTICETVMRNVAVGKTAISSSAWSGSPSPNVLIDGNTERNWELANSCFAVDNLDLNQWWQVDLHNNHIVFEVTITTRSDCCPERLHDFAVDVALSDPATNPDVELKLCFMYDGAVYAPNVTVTCEYPVLGQYLRVSGKKRENFQDVLQICEVEVFAL